MSTNTFKVQSVDHVELFVPNQFEAAKWYKNVLGLEILEEYEFWAKASGPLMISSDGGKTKLALFEGEPRGMRKTAGHHRVAFAVDADGFMEFLQRVESISIYDDNGNKVDSWDVSDHDKSFSVYFCDPYGNRYEITSYDYDEIKSRLAEIPEWI